VLIVGVAHPWEPASTTAPRTTSTKKPRAATLLTSRWVRRRIARHVGPGGPLLCPLHRRRARCAAPALAKQCGLVRQARRRAVDVHPVGTRRRRRPQAAQLLLRNAVYNDNDGLFYVVHFGDSVYALNLNRSSLVVVRRIIPELRLLNNPPRYRYLIHDHGRSIASVEVQGRL
jgi:hypothetical protein